MEDGRSGLLHFLFSGTEKKREIPRHLGCLGMTTQDSFHGLLRLPIHVHDFDMRAEILLSRRRILNFSDYIHSTHNLAIRREPVPIGIAFSREIEPGPIANPDEKIGRCCVGGVASH